MMRSPFEYNVRVFSHTSQGGRKYQEDAFCIAYQKKKLKAPKTFVDDAKQQQQSTTDDKHIDDITPTDVANDKESQQNEESAAKSPPTPTTTKSDLDFVYVGIFDGHGGKEAAHFTRDNLLNNIICLQDFWSTDDNVILKAIKQGFIDTHYKMLKEVAKWPRTASGLLSTAGTTASICFIMNNKYYTGHVGDSKIVLGKKNRETGMWIPHSLTVDHKPESPEERTRIYNAGGEIMSKSGVERVVWYRPKSGHKGPIRRSTSFDRIPFLAVARSLGDLWSYNPDNGVYVVSPEPDVEVIPIDPDEDKCLVLASDGLWNVLLEHECIRLIQEMEEPYEVDRDLLNLLYCPGDPIGYYPVEPTNPSQALVSFALQRWFSGRLRADNTSAVTVLLDHRGPSKQTEELVSENSSRGSAQPTELSEEELKQLVDPVMIPQSSVSSEYFISPDHFPDPKLLEQIASPQAFDDVNLENIPLISGHGLPDLFMHPSRSSLLFETNSQNSKISQDNDKYSVLSPAMQSLCELAKRDNVNYTNDTTKKNNDSVVNGTSDRSQLQDWIHNTDELQMYVNELPEESFKALSEALRLRSSSKIHKVINGVKVFKDYDERYNNVEESTNETHPVMKKYRDECISVTEELVDGRCNRFSASAFKEIAEIAKVWSFGQNHTNDNHAITKESNNSECTADYDPSSNNHFSEVDIKERTTNFFKRRFGHNQRKRKFSGSGLTSSPPAKHLRSSRWSRAKMLPSNKVCKRWRQLAVSLMTTSRLRARKTGINIVK